VSALFLFLGFLTLYKKRFIIAPILLSLSLSIKPTGILLVPLFVFYYLYSRPPFKAIVLSIFTSLIIYFATLSLFTNNNLIFYSQKLAQILFFTKVPVLSASAYNLWFILGGFSKIPDTVTYFLVSAKTWGLLITVVLNLVAFNLIRQKNIKAFLGALFIVSFGSWLFLTNMYERYLFNGILALLFLSIVEKKYLKYFLILSSISLLNMLQGPLAPPQILSFLNFDNMIFAKLLAAINIIIFLKILYTILKFHKNNYKSVI
jgi:Gpi18-like mannosyltransferase